MVTGSERPATGRRAAAPELLGIYRLLVDRFGPRHWWPAKSPFEVAVGAILTQAVAWRNVETAIARLEAAGLMSAQAIAAADPVRLAELVRPAGYYRAKARKLQALADHIVQRYGGRIEAMAARPLDELRPELLGIHGVGRETADDILLYAVGLPSFVVDAYTFRVFGRLGHWPEVFERPRYEDVRAFFQARLPVDASVYNDFHAQIDRIGHHYCLKTGPTCGGCPLDATCRREGAQEDQSPRRSRHKSPAKKGTTGVRRRLKKGP
ncbi:MAG: endonuclease III domain-containing protein [Bacillota bacterium]